MTDLQPEDFRADVDGKSTTLIILTSATDTVAITNYGCRLVAWWTLDQEAQMRDIVLGFDSIEGYLHASEPYHGATIGRYTNRIANGRFSIEDKDYTVDTNLGSHMLHGGYNGWHGKVWDVVDQDRSMVTMEYVSPAGEAGFPGMVTCRVTYRISGSNLQIDYEAETKKSTPLSMTHHSFFNLNGEGAGDILEHTVHIDADHFTEVDADCIPTGKVDLAVGTALDFSMSKTIGQDINSDCEQLSFGNGYDHNYVVDSYTVGEVKYIAKAVGDQSGIELECWSDKCGMQFYTGNHLDGSDIGKAGESYFRRSAFCFEPQFFPDSPNHPDFPSTILQPGGRYQSTTIYKSSVVR